MKNITVFPYPYKITASGDINDGLLCSAPLFCKRQFNSKICRDHYAKVLTSSGFVRCPYGFASERVDICGFTVINTCLNIEAYSDKKSTQKRISNKDHLPRFSLKHYENMLANIRALCSDNKEYYDSLASEESSFSTIEEQKELLNNRILWFFNTQIPEYKHIRKGTKILKNTKPTQLKHECISHLWVP